MTAEDFAGNEVRALSAGAQLTLWCARVWVRHLYDGEPAEPCLRSGLEVAGAQDALEDISAIMTLIRQTAGGQLSFGGCRCRPTTPDEGMFLAAIRAAQDGDRDGAARSFLMWMPPVAARDAALHAARFAAVLDMAAMPVGLARTPTGRHGRRLH